MVFKILGPAQIPGAGIHFALGGTRGIESHLHFIYKVNVILGLLGSFL